MDIKQLNSHHAIAEQLSIISGNGGLPCIEINNEKARALISIYAGQVLEYQPVGDNNNLLFLSNKAHYQSGKAIKGGIPICWPWFGPDPDGLGRSAHGFARNVTWQVHATKAVSENETVISLSLCDDEQSRLIWDHAFELILEISIGASLGLTLTTRNKGDKTFTISQALHTYFNVGDISKVSVEGLDNHDYLDKAASGEQKQQQGAIEVNAEVDRIYLDAPSELIINDVALERRIHINTSGNKTAVVWNPWSDICAQMADLEDNAYQQFICVETTNAADDTVDIEPGGEYVLSAEYKVVSR